MWEALMEVDKVLDSLSPFETTEEVIKFAVAVQRIKKQIKEWREETGF